MASAAHWRRNYFLIPTLILRQRSSMAFPAHLIRSTLLTYVTHISDTFWAGMVLARRWGSYLARSLLGPSPGIPPAIPNGGYVITCRVPGDEGGHVLLLLSLWSISTTAPVEKKSAYMGFDRFSAGGNQCLTA